MSDLHWTFNAIRPEQPEFRERIIATLERFYELTGGAIDESGATYTAFPNYWRGYLPHRTELGTGSLAIRAHQSSRDTWEYRAISHDVTNGESMEVRFGTRDDRFRTVLGAWTVNVTNGTGDRYRSFRAEGRLDKDGGRALLDVNGKRLVLGEVSVELPLTASYCLFHIVPRIDNAVDFAVLDELQRLRFPRRISSVGSCTLEPAGAIRGFCVHGRGAEPSYWWVDRHGTVAVVAGTFRTYVIAEPNAHSGNDS